MENQTILTVKQVEEQIHIAKKQFIKTVSEIGNKSDTKIEISINQRPENVFFRDGERPPFDIFIKELLPNIRSTTPCIFGG